MEEKIMVLKKRLNTFKSSNGKLRNIADEVIIDVLRAWEQWPGKSKELYQKLGLSKMQMTTIIKKAKTLVKNGVVTESEFTEITPSPQVKNSNEEAVPMILRLGKGKAIRFYEVDHLVEFLKKTG